MKEQNKYEELKVEVILFESEDVITNSNGLPIEPNQ